MKVAVLGWYGHRNFGDDLVLEGFRSLFKGWGIVPFSSSRNKFYPVIDFDAVNKCDLFVLGGGELIDAERLFLNSRWVKRVKVPKIVLGCGVNAASASKLEVNMLQDLAGFSYIGLRDVAAVKMLQTFPKLKNRVELFYDLSLQLQPPKPKQGTRIDRAVVVPTDRFSNRYDRGIQKYNTALDYEWLTEQLKCSEVVFLAFGEEDNDDFRTCTNLSKHSDSKNIIIPYKDLSSARVLELLAESSQCISYRLHGLILSYLTGTPYMYYPYHWKLERVAKTLENTEPVMVAEYQRTKLRTVLNEVEK